MHCALEYSTNSESGCYYVTNPYVSGTPVRATLTAAGGQVNGLVPLFKTNTAINSIYKEPAAADVVMDEAEEPVVVPPVTTLTAVAGGLSAVLTKMARAHKLYAIEPTTRSHDQFRRKQEADLIRRHPPPQLEENKDSPSQEHVQLGACLGHAIDNVTSVEITFLRAKVDVLEIFPSSPNLPPEIKALLKPKAKTGNGKVGGKVSTTNTPAAKSNAKNFCNDKKKPVTPGLAT